ncbi:glycoside hydrolase family 9 protein [Vibrio hangzhouensis]|uniref:glycoside hydrolase family 9 protein n=1 Tax=Vibrio hangzhouensis TaxID=462991 RepID=UPI001C982F14|nr:glycoside hydrolase family 9 protein [Vibrio hangzhouensis]MBY6196035.1 glycoside hydrolase family 9 protein [Vibrio hangzhouensis]
MTKYIVTTSLLFGIAISAPISAEEMIRNGSFSKGIDGWWTTGGTINTANGEACMDITSTGSDPWSVILGHAGIGLTEGEKYTIHFDAYASVETQMKTLIQHEGPPYTHYFNQDTLLSTSKQSYAYEFTHDVTSDAGGEFQFQMGAQKTGSICVSNVSVVGKPYIEIAENSPIRANQVGFYPNADKLIFIASESKEPLRWTLQNAQGINIDLGRTQVFGLNPASGEHLHQVDLSAITAEQAGLTVSVDGEKSFPFSIQKNLYRELKHDAFSYFYQNRSGIEIESRFVQRPDLARPAGHLNDVVTCFDKEDAWGNHWPGCDFSIDVTGGWYDAGDHGKYTVNSGITTWTLLNLYERGKWLDSAAQPFENETVNIPEANSEVNPVLSEARWNIEFMLSMQIPQGKSVSVPVGDQSDDKSLQLTRIDASYMAFHKIADEVWTGMPLPPHKDDKKRYVGQPSTAATLNLAAIGAQCARIWREIDSSFAQRCLTASEHAWKAAIKQPEVFAYDNFTGSGPYDDLSLSDDFYWAATELYISTGKPEYRDYLTASPHYLETPKGNIETDGDIFWQYTAPLGTISLAVVPNKLGREAIAQARANIIQTATRYEAQVANEGYHIPYSVKQYPWGSNSNLVNRSLFLIYANDFTGEVRYLKAAANAMDYILGANPMNISYITGYGTNAAQNPHHRFWAKAADEHSPAPAPGALIGGPNSISFSDPIAATMKGKCVGQTCYKDNIGAWSLNEITINWNAPLVWVASALDEGKLN